MRELAKLGATVIIGARGGPARLGSAVSAAREGLSPGAAAGISAMSLDLCSFFSIHTFVQEFLAEHTRLHLLVNNAGVMMAPYALTSDGLESTIGTNHFGHFLLTNLLLDTLLATRGARVVNVSSLAHARTERLTYPLQNSAATYDKEVAYADSKLANLYFTTELERRFGHKGLHAYACHPGFVVSELMRHQPWIVQKLIPILQYFTFKTALQGAQVQPQQQRRRRLRGAGSCLQCRRLVTAPAGRSLYVCCALLCVSRWLWCRVASLQTSLFCALSDKATPGGYHADARPWVTSPAAKDSAKAKWLWEESERVTKLK